MVAESVSRVLVVPSMNVTGSMMGFLDLVAFMQISELQSVSQCFFIYSIFKGPLTVSVSVFVPAAPTRMEVVFSSR